MTIEITRPEVEELINQRLQSGAFADEEELIFRTLGLPHRSRGSVPTKQRAASGRRAHARVAQRSYAGTDYPFDGDAARHLTGLQSCGLNAEELRSIQLENAAKFLVKYAA